MPGGAFFYADDIKLPITRKDISVYPMPVKEIAKSDPNIPRICVTCRNMVYVGVLAQMLGIDMDKIQRGPGFPLQRQTEADRPQLQYDQGRRRMGQATSKRTIHTSSSRWTRPQA